MAVVTVLNSEALEAKSDPRYDPRLNHGLRDLLLQLTAISERGFLYLHQYSFKNFLKDRTSSQPAGEGGYGLVLPFRTSAISFLNSPST